MLRFRAARFQPDPGVDADGHRAAVRLPVASLWLDEQLGAGGWAGGLLLVLASLWAVRLTAAPAEGAPSRAPLAGQPLAEP